MSELLTVEGLRLRYGPVEALAGVTFTVGTGEVVALVGANGAGKTTVLNCISGVTPHAGRITLGGDDLAALPPPARARLGIGRTLQGLGLVDTLDVAGNLLLGRHHRMRAGLVATAFRLGRARREDAVHRARCQDVAVQLGLGSVLSTRAGLLPPGARKRVELGRVLAADPTVLLLDEPFAGASPDEVNLMVSAIVAGARRGAGVLLVDHALETVATVAHRVVRLEAGRVAA